MNPFPFLHITKRHPSAILLLVQLSGMLLYPFIETTGASQVVFNAFGIVVLGVTINMVRRTPGHEWISAGIALPVIVMLILQSGFGFRQLLPWSSALEALFYFYAAGSLIAYMMEDLRATTDELFAAGATFTLLAWGYLSFALLSSTGIGDVIPLTSHARALASGEMLVGLIYLAAVVARLIGFTLQSNKCVVNARPA